MLSGFQIVAEAKRNAAKRFDLRTENGNELVETRSIYAIILSEEMEPLGYCVIPFTSSKMAPWRDFWTRVDTAKISKGAPVFSLLVRLGVVGTKNKKGDKYKNFSMYPACDAKGKLTRDILESVIGPSMLAPDSDAYLAAKTLREAVTSGRATADHETAGAEGAGGGKTGSTDGVF